MPQNFPYRRPPPTDIYPFENYYYIHCLHCKGFVGPHYFIRNRYSLGRCPDCCTRRNQQVSRSMALKLGGCTLELPGKLFSKCLGSVPMIWFGVRFNHQDVLHTSTGSHVLTCVNIHVQLNGYTRTKKWTSRKGERICLFVCFCMENDYLNR